DPAAELPEEVDDAPCAGRNHARARNLGEHHAAAGEPSQALGQEVLVAARSASSGTEATGGEQRRTAVSLVVGRRGVDLAEAQHRPRDQHQGEPVSGLEPLPPGELASRASGRQRLDVAADHHYIVVEVLDERSYPSRGVTAIGVAGDDDVAARGGHTV